jgi:hypothetical protein
VAEKMPGKQQQTGRFGDGLGNNHVAYILHKS